MILTKTGKTFGHTRVLVSSLLLAALMSASLMLAASGPAHAASTFTVTNTKDSGAGSLRQAIDAANANPGADIIEFDIPESEDPGVKTISPVSQLPLVTGAATIDGYSQPGATENTQLVGTDAKLLIELDGTNSRSTGLIIRGSGVEVQGLVINDFVFGGISINNGASNARIEGNFIGTDASGNTAQGNSGNAVSVLSGSNNTIGGAPRTARNLISGNDVFGVEIQQSSSNKVLGNLIGTRKDSKNPLGNARGGVLILDSSNNAVGGDVLGMANTIAFNGGDGVEVRAAGLDTFSNVISNNSILSNGEEGIDLGDDGPTANDPRDADAGANNLQNSPVITSAKAKKGKVTVQGTLDSAPNTTFTVQFFSNVKGGDEGQVSVGQTSVTTDASGKASFAFTPTQAVPKGQAMTATATDPNGNTSEFSAPKQVTKKK